MSPAPVCIWRTADGDVLDAVREIQACDLSLPIIALTERVDEPLLAAALAAGADDSLDLRVDDGALIVKTLG